MVLLRTLSRCSKRCGLSGTRAGQILKGLSWFVVLLSFDYGVCLAAQVIKPIDPKMLTSMTDAIYWTEGGPKARSPYGILSKKVTGPAHARVVATQSVSNNFNRWQQSGRSGEFIQFMANRYVPYTADPIGHSNWVKNVSHLVRKPKPAPPHSRKSQP